MRWVAILGAITVAVLWAGDWRTYSGDAQRTGWAKDEKTLDKSNVSRLKLQWSARLDSEAVEMSSLTAPVVVAGLYTPQGVKDVVIVGGSSDNLFALDAETGRPLWHKKFNREGAPMNKGTGGWLCPNTLNATPYIDRESRTVYAIASDGKLHGLNVLVGEDSLPPVQFVPPFSKNWTLNEANGVLYTTISQNCNGVPSGVHAIDLKNPAHPTKYYRTYGGVWGRAGAAIGSDGRIYAEIGDGPFDPANDKLSDAFIALEPGTLKLLDWYAPTNQPWVDKKDLDMGNISPVVFKFGGRELIAGSGKEGVIFLLDSRSLGGADHRTPLYRSPLYTNAEGNFAGRGFWGALSTWEDPKGTRWLYAPAYGPHNSNSPAFAITHGDAPQGSIMAFRVEDKGGKPELVPAWQSPNMIAPDPVIIANGVVFTLAAGDAMKQVADDGAILPSAKRIAETVPAVLDAFDAETGKPLFSSGTAMKSFAHFSGIALSEGRVFATTFDGTVYCFGLGEQSSGTR